MKVFYVEDDTDIRNLTLYSLKQMKIDVEGFDSAKPFLEALKTSLPDLILLDIMLPDINGITLLTHLRKNKSTEHIPVIMLTAKGAETDIVNALNIGADDYLVKPFGMMELASRINALLRRTSMQNSNQDNIIEAHGIKLDQDSHRVTLDDKELVLTVKEFDLLKLLMTNPGRVLSRSKILESVWNMSFVGESRTVDMHILTLRHKLDSVKQDSSRLIETIRGVGYRFKVDNETKK